MKVEFKDVIDSPCGVRFIYDELPLCSSVARKRLLGSRMMLKREDIEREYTKLSEIYTLLIKGGGKERRSRVERIESILRQLRDVSTTLRRLRSESLLSEVELFEIKQLALLNEDIAPILHQSGVKVVELPELRKVLEILDPEGQKVPSFHVYDLYSERLRELRGEIRRSKSTERDALIVDSLVVEQEIRVELTDRLKECVDGLESALTTLAELDILLAKSRQMEELNLSIPKISSDDRAAYLGMFHPQIADILAASGGKFQPIDIAFDRVPTTIIGANMGGKTVTLKMLALSQYMFQFGFGIPAQSAQMLVVEGVRLIVGDEQSIESGLSSFAAEIKSIDSVISTARRGRHELALIDEPARSTNPIEGSALVAALVEVVGEQSGGWLVVTTHYDLKGVKSNKLRVTGLEDGRMNYRLIESSDGDTPHEAITIAQSLDADQEWLDRAKVALKRGIKE